MSDWRIDPDGLVAAALNSPYRPTGSTRVDEAAQAAMREAMKDSYTFASVAAAVVAAVRPLILAERQVGRSSMDQVRSEQRARGCTCGTRKWGDPPCPLADPRVMASLPPGYASGAARAGQPMTERCTAVNPNWGNGNGVRCDRMLVAPGWHPYPHRHEFDEGSSIRAVEWSSTQPENYEPGEGQK